MDLRDVEVGDIIEVPTCCPSRVTVLDVEPVDVICGVILVRLRWTSPMDDGVTTMSERTRINRMWIAGSDAPIKIGAE